MAAAKLFLIHAPTEYGGADAHPLTALRAIEQLAAGDGSSAWLAMNGSYQTAQLAWLAEDSVAEMQQGLADLRIFGALPPQGTAAPTDGGWRVNGHWTFASGILHANWAVLGVNLLDAAGEPQRSSRGEPLHRIVFLPVGDGEVIDNWDVMGMRGTGSHDYAVHDLFVPDHLMADIRGPATVQAPRFDPRYFHAWGHCVHGADAIGIARGALDRLIARAGDTRSKSTSAPLRDREGTQVAVARAEAILGAARAYLFESVDRAWDATVDDDPEIARYIWRVRLAISHTVEEAARALETLYLATGTNAARAEFGMERAYRDLQVARLHAAPSPTYYRDVGQALLGAEGPALPEAEL